MEKARKLIQDQKVVLTKVQEFYQNSFQEGEIKVCYVWARTITDRGTEGAVKLSFSKEKLISASCRTGQCYVNLDHSYYYSYYHGRQELACEHIAATFLLADEYIKKHHVGDATDYAASCMLRQYRDLRKQKKTVYAQPEEKQETIQLEPRVVIGSQGQLELSFKIGCGKLYILKNLNEFGGCVDNYKAFPLGKKETLSFMNQTFCEEALKYYRFIEREVKDENMRNHHIRSMNHNTYYDIEVNEEIKSAIPLYGRKLDTFFEICKDSTVALVRKDGNPNKKGELILKNAMPELQLEVQPNVDKYNELQGITIRGERPLLISGESYKYFLKENTLNRAEAAALLPISLLPASEDGKIQMTVGRRNLTEFYHKILPVLKEFAQVTETGDIEIGKYIYPEAKYVFLIDAPENNVVCEAKAIYGGTECKLAKPEQDGGVYEVFRDMSDEMDVEKQVKKYFPYEEMGNGEYDCQGEEEIIFHLVSEGVPALMKIGEVRATERFKRLNIRKKPQVNVGVRLESDLLNLSVTSSEYSEEELLELLSSYRKKKKYHRLKNGDFVSVDNSTMEELSMMMNALQIAPKDFVKGDMSVPAYRALYLDKMLEKNDALYAKRDKHFKELIKNFKTVGDSDYELPESFTDVARNYQDYGYKWLRTIGGYRFGGVLADDMGLGKTMQMIAVLQAAKDEGNLDTALIVTPASLVFNWKAEFEKFAPKLDVEIVTGTKSERGQKISQYKNHDVLVTSYDLLKRDINEYEGKMFSYHVIDEAQYIKTHTTAAAKAVKAVSSRIRFALTGTPIENRLSELWSIFDFLMPGFLYSYDKFRKELERPISKNHNEEAMTRLKRMVTPFILRRLKGDVLTELPEKLEEVQYVVFEKEQQTLYDGQVVRMRKMLVAQSEDDFLKNKIQILAEITRLRQICCEPSLYLENYKERSVKRQACLELIQSAIEGEHKILVFSQFTSMLDLLECDLQAEGIPCYKITGATKKEDRVELVCKFNENDVPVFLISLKAGGTGLNLTGADIVIHYDPWWNIAAQNQATDRAHRIGQQRQVTVFKLIVKDTIEEKILKLQESKRQLAEGILSGQTGNIMSMSKEELYELL